MLSTAEGKFPSSRYAAAHVGHTPTDRKIVNQIMEKKYLSIRFRVTMLFPSALVVVKSSAVCICDVRHKRLNMTDHHCVDR